MKSLIGASYVPLDNSYGLFLSQYNWDRSEYKHCQLAGNMVGLDPQRVTIISEPFIMVHNDEDRKYEMVIVKDSIGNVYTVMFNTIGLTVTDKELRIRKDGEKEMLRHWEFFDEEYVNNSHD